MSGLISAMRSPRTLDLLSVLLVAAAVGARWLPLSPPNADPDARERAPVAWSPESLDVATAGGALDRALNSRVTGGDSASYAGVVRGNLFSPTRRAPSTRFQSPLADAGALPPESPEVAAAMTSMSGAADAIEPSGDETPRLFGIVSVDGERRALLALLADRPPRLLRVGEREGAYRLLAIDQDRVRVQTPGGVRTLRLQRATPSGVAGDSLIPHP